jgi:hypothetical protein
MSRPHVEFVQAQALPWDTSPWRYLAGCQVKLLSRDPDGGATSALVRFPADWRAALPGHLDCAHEIYLLEGELELDGRRYEPDCYGAFPADYPLHSLAAPRGAVALMLFEHEPHWLAEPGAPAASDAARPVGLRDAFELPWEAAPTGPPQAVPAVQWKVLRGSPHGDAATLLTWSPPHLHPPGWRGPQAVHACATELFLVSGYLISHAGQMCVGAYLWRPPGIAHGPYGTRGGNLALVRVLGGPFFGRPTPHEVEIARESAQRPVLPESVRAQRLWPWRPQRF